MRNKVIVAIAVGAALLVACIYALKDRKTPETPPQAAPSASQDPAAPSEFPLCRDLQAVYGRMSKTLGCASHDTSFVKALCELPYGKKGGCMGPLETAHSCIKATSADGWMCETNGTVGLKETTCAEQVKALSVCLNN